MYIKKGNFAIHKKITNEDFANTTGKLQVSR